MWQDHDINDLSDNMQSHPIVFTNDNSLFAILFKSNKSAKELEKEKSEEED